MNFIIENAKKIIEQNGSCEGVNCKSCPLHTKNRDVCSDIIKEYGTAKIIDEKTKLFCVDFIKKLNPQLEFVF